MRGLKQLLNKLIRIKDIIGLMFILFYFLYIGFSMSINKGNNTLHLILLGLTIIYLIVYVLSVFTFENKKVKKVSGKTFKRLKKFIGFVNTVMILVSVISNPFKSFFTIIFSIISIMTYIIHTIIDIAISILIHKVKGFVKGRNENRD